MNNPLIIILGPTASGKTKLAVALANHYNGEIISADSRQIFKKMDIGTGKDLEEYQYNRNKIPYHLIDILEPGERYHVAAFIDDFFDAFNQINEAKHVPIICGGTGMYVHALLQNHSLTNVPVDLTFRSQLVDFSKEELVEKLHQYPLSSRENADESTVKRLIRAIEIAKYLQSNKIPTFSTTKLNPIVIGLNPPVELRRTRILNRLNERLKNGLVEEVKQLISSGVPKDMLVFYGLEYKLTVNYLDGSLDFETYQERLGTAICQYAKRQMTFFRKMEKDGIGINWIDSSVPFSEVLEKSKFLIDSYLRALI